MAGSKGKKSRSRSKKDKKKGKKKEKLKRALRKYNLDLFGILTFTRFYGSPWENWMYIKGKGKKGKKPKVAANKKGKKKNKGKKEEVPNLPKFPELPPLPIRRRVKKGKDLNFIKETILPYVDTGYGRLEKTTRPPRPLQRAGSLRDVLCGPKFPLPPRPQPHGGVMGDMKCGGCKAMNQLTETPYPKLNKKLRKQIVADFEKAKYIIEYLRNNAHKSIDLYREHIQSMVDVLGPALDDIDNSEWDDHFQVRDLIDKWRKLKKELQKVKKEYRYLRDNQDAEIQKLLADKLAEVEAAERRLHEVEKQLKEAIETLEDWRTNHERKLKEPQDEIDRLTALLASVKNSVYAERDYLRELLAWETKTATDQTVAEMERIIAEDINYILNWMHPAWLNLVLENRKLEQENNTLTDENHLLELEVETLDRQIKQHLINKQKFENTKTHEFRPLSLQNTVDKFFKHRGRIQIYEFPTTELLHE